MTVYFPTTPVVRTTTEGNLHFYRNALVEYRERGNLVQRLLTRPGHFWIRQDGKVTIRHAGGTLKGAVDFRLIGGLDHGGHLTDGALGERPEPTDPARDFLNDSGIPLVHENRVDLMRALVAAVRHGKVPTPDEYADRPLRWSYDQVNRLVGPR